MLNSAHKGYEYQDLLSAYFVASYIAQNKLDVEFQFDAKDFDGDKCIFQDYYFHIKNSVLNSDDWKVELFSLNTNSKESRE